MFRPALSSQISKSCRIGFVLEKREIVALVFSSKIIRRCNCVLGPGSGTRTSEKSQVQYRMREKVV